MEKTLYHGTNRRFKKFVPSADGLFGAGIYLTDDAEDAMQYGDRLAVVEANLVRPFYTVADYAISEAYDVDTPAGRLILDVLGEIDGSAALRRMATAPDFGIGGLVTDRLLAVGHDGIVARWSNGIEHVIAFRADQVRLIDWIPVPSGTW